MSIDEWKMYRNGYEWIDMDNEIENHAIGERICRVSTTWGINVWFWGMSLLVIEAEKT